MEFDINTFMELLNDGKDAGKYLKDHPEINKLSFSGVSEQLTHENLTRLADVLETNDTVELLNFNNCNIKDEGLEDITKALQNNKTVTSLYLNENNLTSKSGKNIGKILMKNETLRVLHLSNNDLGDKGLLMLTAGL